MLHLKHSHQYHLPHFASNSRQLVFEPVASEDDELVREIEQAAQGEQWTLSAVPDVQALDAFWGEVQQDLHADPTWIQFSDEE